MSEEVVRLKGTRTGLTLTWPLGTDFGVVLGDLKRKLASGTKFFRRGIVMQLQSDRLSEEQAQTLQELFDEYGMVVKLTAPPPPAPPEPPATDEPRLPAFAVNALRKPLVVEGTVRGGKEIRNLGSVLVNGNVNAGALITAGGNIEVRGWCRGVVHAGFLGDRHAYIVADKLEPTQIRIADLIAPEPEQDTPPEMERGGNEVRPQRAYIRNGQIVVEALTAEDGNDMELEDEG